MVIESAAVVREIHFKTGEEKAANACLGMLDRLGKVLATNIVDGKWLIIARFDDGLDYLAFLAAIGAVKVKGVTDD